jgi:carboxymethylenebutenolidase
MEITSGSTHVPVAGGSLPVFVARPAAPGKYPAIIVVMEAFGLNGHIKKVAERIAREGCVAVAPDMYHRAGQNIDVGYDNLPEAIRLMTGLRDEDIVADMKALTDYLQAQDFVRADRIGITGFCMGGRISFLTACRNPAIKAAVPFYGGGIGSVQPSEKTPKAPLDYADQLQAPMLLFFGEADPFIPLDEVERIKKRLAELHKDAETVVYPGAPHGFFCDERDSYRADAARDAWDRMGRFFDRHLKS